MYELALRRTPIDNDSFKGWSSLIIKMRMIIHTTECMMFYVAVW